MAAGIQRIHVYRFAFSEVPGWGVGTRMLWHMRMCAADAHQGGSTIYVLLLDENGAYMASLKCDKRFMRVDNLLRVFYVGIFIVYRV